MNDQEKRLWWQAYRAALTGYCGLPGEDGNGLNFSSSAEFAAKTASIAVQYCEHTEPTSDPPWDGHARVELMGHRSYLGRIREIDRYGMRLGEVQELLPDGTYGAVHQWGGKSLYNLDPLTEEEALQEARPERVQYCGGDGCDAYFRLTWGDPGYLDERPLCEECRLSKEDSEEKCTRCSSPATCHEALCDTCIRELHGKDHEEPVHGERDEV